MRRASPSWTASPRTAPLASARSLWSFRRPKASRFWPTTSSDVVSRTCSPSVAGGAIWAAGRSRQAKQTARSPSATTPAMRDGRRRARPARSLLHNDLAVLPGGWQTDIEVVTRLIEGDGLRAAFDQHPGVPLAPFHRRRRVWQIADVGEGHGGARLDPNARRPEAVLHVVGAHPDRVGVRDDRSRGPGDRLGWGRWPQRTQLSLQRERPHRVAIRAALQLVTPGRDHDELLTVHFIDHGRGVSPETGLESPQLLARLGVEREDVAVGLPAEDEAPGGDRRTAATADPVRGLVLPGDLVRLAVDRRERPGHR